MSMVKTTTAKTPLIIKVVSLYVIFASLIWMGNYYIQATKPVLATTYRTIETKQTEVTISGQPSHMTIDRLGIDLPIAEGTYDKTSDSWTLNDTTAFFASITALPNNKDGNTFIYGHNIASVLEPVKDIVPGDLLTITTTNGHAFNYVYVDDITVTPDQTSILSAESPKPRVTLMTCQGLFSDTRRVMHFDFIGLS